MENLSASVHHSKFYAGKKLRKCNAFSRTAIPKLRSVESRGFIKGYKGLRDKYLVCRIPL